MGKGLPETYIEKYGEITMTVFRLHVGFINGVIKLATCLDANQQQLEKLAEIEQTIRHLFVKGGFVTKDGRVEDASAEITGIATIFVERNTKPKVIFQFTANGKLKVINPNYNGIITYLNDYAKKQYKLVGLENIDGITHPNNTVKQIILDLMFPMETEVNSPIEKTGLTQEEQ